MFITSLSQKSAAVAPTASPADCLGREVDMVEPSLGKLAREVCHAYHAMLPVTSSMPASLLGALVIIAPYERGIDF